MKSLLKKSLVGEQTPLNDFPNDKSSREHFIITYYNTLLLRRGKETDELNDCLIAVLELKILRLGFKNIIKNIWKNGITFLTENEAGLTSLHYIVEEKGEDFIQYLYELGLDFTVKSRDGMNCAFYALYKKNFSVFKFLYNKGLEPIAPYRLIFRTMKK